MVFIVFDSDSRRATVAVPRARADAVAGRSAAGAMAKPAATGAVVKLGDVAEIFTADRQAGRSPGGIELFPAPLAATAAISPASASCRTCCCCGAST